MTYLEKQAALCTAQDAFRCLLEGLEIGSHVLPISETAKTAFMVEAGAVMPTNYRITHLSHGGFAAHLYWLTSNGQQMVSRASASRDLKKIHIIKVRRAI